MQPHREVGSEPIVTIAQHAHRLYPVSKDFNEIADVLGIPIVEMVVGLFWPVTRIPPLSFPWDMQDELARRL